MPGLTFHAPIPSSSWQSLVRFVTNSLLELRHVSSIDQTYLSTQCKCQICDIEIEDEFHFMFVCPLHVCDRTKLSSRYYMLSMQKFADLINEPNVHSLINWVGKLICKSSKFVQPISINIENLFICVYHKSCYMVYSHCNVFYWGIYCVV